MRTVLLALMLLVGCRSKETVEVCGRVETACDADARHQLRVLDDRTLLIEAKLEELDRCLTMKMTMVEDVFQLKVGIQTCVAVMRNVQGSTP